MTVWLTSPAADVLWLIMDTRMGLKNVFTNLVQCQTLNDHPLGTVLSNSQRSDVSQQVSDLFVINLETTDVVVNRIE